MEVTEQISQCWLLSFPKNLKLITYVQFLYSTIFSLLSKEENRLLSGNTCKLYKFPLCVNTICTAGFWKKKINKSFKGSEIKKFNNL